MGIPGFFGFISKYNDRATDEQKIIKKTITQLEGNPNGRVHLFLDFNGAVYTALHKSNAKTEESLLENTIGYLDVLISILAKDHNLYTIVIAMDGVPPRPKVEQQRGRRFHSVDEKNSKLKLNEQYAVEDEQLDISGVNTNIITPGTSFTYKLGNRIKEHINTSELYQNKTVIFSGVDEPGEGEHKILQYIKKESSNNSWTEDDYLVIYGLDADLIMLSMASHVNNIYLLREKTEYGSYSTTFNCEGYDFLYLDIDNTKLFIIKEIEDFVGEIDDEYITRFIDDYIALCFILGNDFIPKIPWLSIKNNGYEKLLDAYFQVYNLHREFLVDTETMKMNHMLLYYLFEKLAEIETREMIYYHKKRQRQRIFTDGAKTELEKRNIYLKFFPIKGKNLDIEKVVSPETPGWRERYYKLCFNMKYETKNINMIVQKYLEAIIWSFRYYFDNVNSWDWYYPYLYGPTCEDIIRYMNEMNRKNSSGFYGIKNINQIKFTKGKPMKPQELLVMVLPYASRHIMCNSVASLISTKNNPLSLYFPKRYGIAIPYHTFYWECKPILPPINYEHIKQVFKSIKLTSDEQNRNVNNELSL